MDGQNIELKPSKKIIYLDQNLISEIVNNHNAGRDSFFSILYDKFMNAIMAEKIVCPYSVHHTWESALGGEEGKAYQDMIWKMSYGIGFLIPCEIEDNQISNSVEKYCRKQEKQNQVID